MTAGDEAVEEAIKRCIDENKLDVRDSNLMNWARWQAEADLDSFKVMMDIDDEIPKH